MLSVLACDAIFQHATHEKQAASACISVLQLQGQLIVGLLCCLSSNPGTYKGCGHGSMCPDIPSRKPPRMGATSVCIQQHSQRAMMTMRALHQAYAVEPVLPCATKWPSSELWTQQSFLAIPAVTGLRPVA